MPTFGSLFAGIGGIDLGLERAGWTGRWQVEWDDYCQRVLAKHWPDIPRYGDITTVDWSTVEPVDLIAGGFPCQPFSLAGQRRGKSDDRWLWPAFATAIRALRPSYVLVENVPGLLAGHGGMGAVLGGLADLGYDTEWDCIPAAAVGAPHLRYRVWIVAHSNADGDGRGDGPRPRTSGGGRRSAFGWFEGLDTPLAYPDGLGRNGWTGEFGSGWRGQPQNGGHPLADAAGERQPEPRFAEQSVDPTPDTDWKAGEPVDGRSGESPLPDAKRRGRDRGTSNPERGPFGRAAAVEAGAAGRRSEQWLVEPDVGRVAHGVPARVDRLRSLGNAVVPQVVEVIGRALLEAAA